MKTFLFIAVPMAAALGSGLMGGVFFAFSVFVMRALARLDAPAGIAAMQSINRAVLNPLFMAAFFGTAAACLIVILASSWRWREPGAILLAAGGATYLVGGVLVTMACNVPLNRALAEVAPDERESAARWSYYLERWTAWNHVRTVACLVASALLIIAIYFEAGSAALP